HVLLSLRFFFFCLPTTPYLLSFPTRRSSDLVLSFLRIRSRSFIKISAVPSTDFNMMFPVKPSDRTISFAPFKRTVGSTLPVKFKDRKSTRLNSSHVSISYAVFCLKKKKH